ncbi:MAG: CPBP family intramembrane metalloprotease [Anaerolineae bacterium]|jgi:membrane protease YdiL (CAAX protease family)
MRRNVLLPLVVFAVQIPLTIACVAGLLPIHPIVMMLPLVGLLNRQIERRGPEGLGLAIVQPVRSLLLALAFAVLGFVGRLIALRFDHVPLRVPPLTVVTIGSLVKDLAVDLVIIALWEEIVDRGYIQTRLQAAWGFSGVVVTTLLFASLHMPSALHDYGWAPRILFRFVQTGLAGFMLGYLYWWTGSVLPTIAVHGLRNFLMLTVTQHLSGVTATRLLGSQMPFQLLWLVGEVGLMLFVCRPVFGRRRSLSRRSP